VRALAIGLAVIVLLPGCAGIGNWGTSYGAAGSLKGTWERLEMEAPQYRHIKMLAGDHFVWVSYDRSTGLVAAVGGGTYLFDGRTYIESLEFGNEALPAELIGEDQFFTARLYGDEWHHQGTLSNGFEVREVWLRIK
jgi:hypothetical protein